MYTRLFMLFSLIAQINYAQVFYIRFPDDVNTTVCNISFDFGEPVFFNPDGLELIVDYTDAQIFPVPDACLIIDRNWRILRADTYDPSLPCDQVPNPTPNLIAGHPDNLPGPVVAPLGAAAPWEPTWSNILPFDPLPTSFSVFWNEFANCYQYNQRIKVTDLVPPVIGQDCPVLPIVWTDSSANDPDLWHAAYWQGPFTGSDDLKEGEVELSLAATDSCYGANVNIAYLLFLDLDQDGTMESVVNSMNPPPPGMVRYNNANTPNGAGGELRQFDQRNVPAAELYAFGTDWAVDGTNRTATVRWKTLAGSVSVPPQLPPGTHKIRWITGDPCGNQSICEYSFTIENPLSGSLSPEGQRAGVYLYAPEPNPAVEQFDIRFYLPEASQAGLYIRDVRGVPVWSNREYRAGGEHRIQCTKAMLGCQGGVFWVILETPEGFAVRKLILK